MLKLSIKPFHLPKIEKSAKAFLIKLVPQLLQACGVEPEQTFYGFKFNIENEAHKRIWAMSEKSAKTAVEALKELLNEW